MNISLYPAQRYALTYKILNEDIRYSYRMGQADMDGGRSLSSGSVKMRYCSHFRHQEYS